MNKKHLTFFISLLSLAASLKSQNTVTKAEAIALGQKLEKEVAGGNAAAFFLTVDSATFYGKIQTGSKVAQDPQFMKGFLSSFSLLQFAGPVQEVVKRGSFHFLRDYEKGGTEHLIFRLLPGNGINYYDVTLIKTKGAVKIADMLFYINGENLSITLINLIETMADNVNSADDIINRSSALLKLAELKKKGDWIGVKSEYDQLEEQMKHNKALEIFNLLACQHIDNPSYKKALELYASDFPDATNAYLMMIDMYALNGEYEKSIVAINKIDSLTGGDPALDYFRAVQYINLKKPDSALQCYLRVFDYDPSLTNNVKKLVEFYENAGDKEKAKKVFAQYQKTPAVKPAFVENLYAEFADLK